MDPDPPRALPNTRSRQTLSSREPLSSAAKRCPPREGGDLLTSAAPPRDPRLRGEGRKAPTGLCRIGATWPLRMRLVAHGCLRSSAGRQRSKCFSLELLSGRNFMGKHSTFYRQT